ncbi:uncharacterized protein LOC106531651 isoform X2 [Austrofundulus limnaeus]|uniref:Uncharacterized protein LOC106531651 isoform X2 n=2 Tax=Austrofundulus limnaeus TaxID=52670 RepID=A0A2I4CSP1_AUSLI|nr:PREDICTED: uncharacterized protein LOC106531651 isoform X2 [Austrofundulus limnaeus]
MRQKLQKIHCSDPGRVHVVLQNLLCFQDQFVGKTRRMKPSEPSPGQQSSLGPGALRTDPHTSLLTARTQPPSPRCTAPHTGGTRAKTEPGRAPEPPNQEKLRSGSSCSIQAEERRHSE